MNIKSMSLNTNINQKKQTPNNASNININSPTLLEDFIKASLFYSAQQSPLKHIIAQTTYLLSQHTRLSKNQKQHLDELKQQVDSPAKIAIIGQFSSGKSTFLNALLGQNILPSGITPVTAKICEISYGDSFALEVVFNDNTSKIMPLDFLNNQDEILNSKIKYYKLFAPLEYLREINFLDTPGLNSQNQSDTDVTTKILREVDGIIWLSLIDNVGKNSEKEILQANIKQYATKSLCVLNQKDRLKNNEEIQTSLNYAKKAFDGLFEDIVAISSKQALESTTPKDTIDSNIQVVLDFINTNILPKSALLKQHKILNSLKRLIIYEHYKTHKTRLFLMRLNKILTLQSQRLIFNALQSGLEKRLNILFSEVESRLENLSITIFNALETRDIPFVEEHKNFVGWNSKTTQLKQVVFLPKDTLLSRLNSDESEMLRNFRKSGFAISSFGKEFLAFLDSQKEYFEELINEEILSFKSTLKDQNIKDILEIIPFEALKKDYEIAQLKAFAFLQKELYYLQQIFVAEYSNALSLCIEKLESKMLFALKKYTENPNTFSLFVPTLENIRNLLNDFFHFTLFQEKLFLNHSSLYKKTLWYADEYLGEVAKKYGDILNNYIAICEQANIALISQLQFIKKSNKHKQ